MTTQHPHTTIVRSLTFFRRGAGRALIFALVLAMVAAACGDSTTASTDPGAEETTTSVATTEPPADPVTPSTSVRDSGLTTTVQPAGDLVVHSLTAPQEVFANSTHIIETENALVVVDTQFLLPNAADFRAYADSLGKPIDRVFITHAHPDHFLGSEAFADVPIYALEEVSAAIAANGDAEVEEKQGDFGAEAIAGSYVVPEVVEPGTIDIDG
ncbi:MAG: MBL fold metallo-hydrolase, partial [Acidimicrobiia bacterium]|nr:MBL fold metallo-hydrolase [Acidimicrobiia bacterium]